MKGNVTGGDMAHMLGDWLNGAMNKDLKEFVEVFTTQVHRTLQQRGMSLFVGLVQKYAELREAQYDARNEGTVKLAKEIVQNVDSRWFHLPFI